MAKEVIIKLTIPDWVDEERVKAQVHRVTEELLASTEQSADEARRFLGVRKLRGDIEVPEGLGSKLLELRRKRTW